MRIPYTLVRKKVKNINLRVHPDGSVTVSAPKSMPKSVIDAFLNEREAWILSAQKKAAQKKMPPDTHSDEECMKKFLPIATKMLEVAGFLKELPEIRVRYMSSCWGVCHPQKGYITLNKALYDKPIEAVEYVILHEFVHFILPNHGAEFHRIMGRLMPDYKERKKKL